MRVIGALGHAGRAAGKEHRRRGRFAAAAAARHVGCASSSSTVMPPVPNLHDMRDAELRAPAPPPCSRRAGVADEDRGVDIAQQRLKFGLRVGWIERRDLRARRHAGEQADQASKAVAHHERDAFVRHARPPSTELPRHRADGLGIFAVGKLALLADDARRIRTQLRGLRQGMDDRSDISGSPACGPGGRLHCACSQAKSPAIKPGDDEDCVLTRLRIGRAALRPQQLRRLLRPAPCRRRP